MKKILSVLKSPKTLVLACLALLCRFLRLTFHHPYRTRSVMITKSYQRNSLRMFAGTVFSDKACRY